MRIHTRVMNGDDYSRTRQLQQKLFERRVRVVNFQKLSEINLTTDVQPTVWKNDKEKVGVVLLMKQKYFYHTRGSVFKIWNWSIII